MTAVTDPNTAEIAVCDLTSTQLYIEFNRLAGRGLRVDRRWSEKRIRAEIQAMRDQRAESQARADKQAAEDAERQAARDARIAARGSFEDFAKLRFSESLEKDEGKLAYLASRVIGHEAAFAAEVAAFSEKALKNPAFAMDWSMGLYEAAAKAEIGRLVRHIVEKGMLLSDLQDILTRDVMNEAASPQRSTSVASNLMKQELTAKKADMLRDIVGRGFY